MQSVRNDQYEAARLLLQSKADGNLKSSAGWTAMDLAQMYSHSSIQAILKEAQALPSSPAAKGVGDLLSWSAAMSSLVAGSDQAQKKSVTIPSIGTAYNGLPNGDRGIGAIAPAHQRME